MIPIKYDAAFVESRGEKLHAVWWQGKQWAVTSYGLERRDGTYCIEASRLCEEHKAATPYSWIKQMGIKIWSDIDDFATAFFVACALHGHKLSRKEVEMLNSHWAQVKARRANRGS